VPATPGTCAGRPAFPRLATSRATRVNFSCNAFQLVDTIVLIVFLELQNLAFPRKSRWTCVARILQLKETLNTMVEQLRSVRAEVTRVRGKSPAKAAWRTSQRAGVAGTWKDLTDSVNAMARQPDRSG